MADRPDILTAKLDRIAAIAEDAEHLKSQPQKDRPNDASMDAVNTAYSTAMADIAGDFGSVAGVQDVKLPSNRL